MKNPALIACVTLCLTAGNAAFARENNFNNAKKEAAQRNLAIFAYFSMSDNSERCARLERRILRRPEFQNFLKANFVFFQADFPIRNSRTYNAMPEEIKEQNRKLAIFYRVKDYPTVLLMNSAGEIIARLGYDGKTTAEQFIETLQRALNEQHKK